jgi:hypothetical protein
VPAGFRLRSVELESEIAGTARHRRRALNRARPKSVDKTDPPESSKAIGCQMKLRGACRFGVHRPEHRSQQWITEHAGPTYAPLIQSEQSRYRPNSPSQRETKQREVKASIRALRVEAWIIRRPISKCSTLCS